MSTDPKLPDYVRQALERLRAAHPAEASSQAPAVNVENVLERVLRDLPDMEPLSELPGLSDDDWDSPDADFEPEGGDGGGGADGGGPEGGGAVDGGGDVGSAGDLGGGGPGDGIDVLPDAAGTSSLVSLLAAPISLGKALLTLALPAALVGSMLTTVAVGSRRAQVEGPDAPNAPDARGRNEEAAPLNDSLETSRQVAEESGPEVSHATVTSLQVGGVARPASTAAAAFAPGPLEAAAPSTDLDVAQDLNPRDTLSAERRLIDAARAAMTRRDAESCMRFVAQHRRRFEDGALAEERDAMDVRCQIISGDPAAERAAADFRRRYPGSFQLGVHTE
jgi:hypothetical protein